MPLTRGARLVCLRRLSACLDIFRFNGSRLGMNFDRAAVKLVVVEQLGCLNRLGALEGNRGLSSVKSDVLNSEEDA